MQTSCSSSQCFELPFSVVSETPESRVRSIPRMDEEDVILLCMAIVTIACGACLSAPRRWWIRDWIGRRSTQGFYNSLLQELVTDDPDTFQSCLRMNKATYDSLLEKVAPLISKKDTVCRQAISAGERLAVTLRFLASGDSYPSLELLTRIPANTISKIIPEVCDAIYRVLRDDFLKVPDTQEKWREIAEQFEKRWNLPNCIGAVDGKHVSIRKPDGAGAEYFNYKSFNSIVLFAVVDANYNFLYVDVGCNGRVSDGGVFLNSSLYEAMEKNELNMPPPRCLPDRPQKDLSYFFVGDDAFPLKHYLQKPYPAKSLTVSRRVFNYRLSRARRIVENVFGIITNRFAVMQKPMNLNPNTTIRVVLACCALHNFLRAAPSRQVYAHPTAMNSEDPNTGNFTPGRFAHVAGDCLGPLDDETQTRSTASAHEIRDILCDYFNTNGSVPWQWEKAFINDCPQ